MWEIPKERVLLRPRVRAAGSGIRVRLEFDQENSQFPLGSRCAHRSLQLFGDQRKAAQPESQEMVSESICRDGIRDLFPRNQGVAVFLNAALCFSRGVK